MGVNSSFQLLIHGLLFGVGLTEAYIDYFPEELRIRSYIVRIPPIGEGLPVNGNMTSLNCSITAHVSDSEIHTVKFSVLFKDEAHATSVKITNSKTGQNISTQLINQTTFDFTTSDSGDEYEIFISFQLFLPVHEPSITLVKDSFLLEMFDGFQFHYYLHNVTFIIGRDLNQKYRIVSDVKRIKTETENLNNSNLGENTKLVWEHYKLGWNNQQRIKVFEFLEYSLQFGEPANGKSVTVLMEKSLHQKTLPLSNWLLQNTAETAEALIHYYEGIFNTPMPMTVTEIFLLFSDDHSYAGFTNNYFAIHLARSDLSMENRTDLELGIAFEMSHCLVDPWISKFTNSKSGRTWHSMNMCAGLKSHISFVWGYEYLQSWRNVTWPLPNRYYLKGGSLTSQYIFQALELMLSRNFVQDVLKPLLHSAATPNATVCNEARLLKALDDHVLKQNAQGLLPEGKILASEIVEGLQDNEFIIYSEIRIDSLESLSDNSQLSICVYNTKKNIWLPIKIDFVMGTDNDSRSNSITTKLWVNPHHGCYKIPVPEPGQLRFLTVSCGDLCPVAITYLSNILTRLVSHAGFLSADQKAQLMYHQDQIMRSPKLRTDPTDTINALELTKLCKGSEALKFCYPWFVLHMIAKISYQITFEQDNEHEHKLVLDYFSPLIESAVVSFGGIENIMNSEFFKICVMLEVPVCTNYVAKFVKLWVTNQNENVFNKWGTNRDMEFWKCGAVRLEDSGNEIWNFLYEKFMETVQDPVNNSYKVREYLRILRCTKNNQQFLKLLRIVLDLDTKGQFGSITNTAALFQHNRKFNGPDLYSLSDGRMRNVLSFAEKSLSEENSGTKSIREFMLIAETILSEDAGLFHCRVGSSEWKIWFNRFQEVLERNKAGKRLNLGDFRNSTCDEHDYWYTELKWWQNSKNATLEWLRQNTILGANSGSSESSAMPNSHHHHYYYYGILAFVVLSFIVVVLAFVWKRRMSSEDNYLRMLVNRNNPILVMETEE